MIPPRAFPAIYDATLVSELLRLRAAWLTDGRHPRVGAADLEALVASTGWPAAHATEAIRRAFAPYTEAALAAMVRRGSAANGRAPWLLAILAGRIPAVAASVAVRSLAARVPVAIKPSSAEPAFARMLVASVRGLGGPLADAVHLLDRPSGDPDLAAAVARAPACLVHGSDDTVAAVLAARRGLPTLAGAHRESLAILFRDALTLAGAPRLAGAVARDVSIYDQDGCLSPHVVLVEEGGEVPPGSFAAALSDALRRAAARLPMAPAPLGAAARVRLFVEEHCAVAERVGGGLAGGRGPVPPAVLLGRGPCRPGPGLRVVQVVPFEGRPDLPRLVPSLVDRVQGIAVAGERSHLADTLAACPEFRPCLVCAPGRLQLPPADWPENGVRLAEWLAGLTSEV